MSNKDCKIFQKEELQCQYENNSNMHLYGT